MFSAKLKLQLISDVLVEFEFDRFAFFRKHRVGGRLLFRFLQLSMFLRIVKLEDLATEFLGFELRWLQESFSSTPFMLFSVALMLNARLTAFGGDSRGRPFTTKSIIYIQRYLCKTDSHLSVYVSPSMTNLKRKLYIRRLAKAHLDSGVSSMHCWKFSFPSTVFPKRK